MLGSTLYTFNQDIGFGDNTEYRLIKQNRRFRTTLFLHQDGIALGMIISAFEEKGILDYILEREQFHIGDVLEKFGPSSGHLNVALRCFASQGWIDSHGTWGTPELELRLTERCTIAAQSFSHYVDASRFVIRHLSERQRVIQMLDNRETSVMTRQWSELVDRAVGHWGLDRPCEHFLNRAVLSNCVDHLDGILAVPIMTALKLNGGLEEESLNPDGNPEAMSAVLKLFSYLDWIHQGTNSWTKLGKVACDYALHYGLMSSYLPMMSQLPELLFHGKKEQASPGSKESHVDRALNVLASGVAHRAYFSDADSIFLEIFNKEPFEEQPNFVADMGCGDGSWLRHIYELVAQSTKRGKVLDRFPLVMVGADYNREALDVARQCLQKASVPAHILWGDIGNPKQLEKDLRAQGIHMKDVLHIRSFIDHNRAYEPPQAPMGRQPEYKSTGAYVDANGNVIPAAHMEQNLVAHFAKWYPYAQKHGLIIIESHTVEPKTAAKHLGRLHSIAFDTYHGCSNQYPVEFEVFMWAAEKAGFQTKTYHQTRYPSRLPFVAISLNHFVVPDPGRDKQVLSQGRRPVEGEWSPAKDLPIADGQALHRFVFQDGDIQKPKRWCFAATGILLRKVLLCLAENLEMVRRGEHEPRITVLDYGSGTGLATIELIKACRQNGLLAEMDFLKIDFKILMLDLPTGWFAKGHALLKDCPYVRFYSLRDQGTGAFLPLSQVIQKGQVDLVIASMVFHLLPPRAIGSVMENLNEVLRPTGELVWNTPDMGPTLSGACLFHDPNRELRQTWLRVRDEPMFIRALLSRVPEEEKDRFMHLIGQMEQIRAGLTAEKRLACEQIANRQILPEPNDQGLLTSALGQFFSGEIFCKTFEMRFQESLQGILIPANQRYLSDIEDTTIRQRLIELMMRYWIHPRISQGDAATTYGFNLQWTFGFHRKIEITHTTTPTTK